MTHGHALGLSEEARLQLAAKAITTVRQLDPRRRSSSRSTSRGPSTWPPSSSIWRRSTLPTRWSGPTWASPASGSRSTSATIRADRSIAARWRISRLVDTWSLLELPLLVSLTLPSSAADDPQANGKVRVLSGERRRRHARIAARLDRTSTCRCCWRRMRSRSFSGTSFPTPRRTTIRTAACSTPRTSRSRRSKRCERSANNISTAESRQHGRVLEWRTESGHVRLHAT